MTQPTSHTLRAIEALVERSDAIIEGLKATALESFGGEKTARTYSITEAAEMVDKTPQTIRNAEKAGLLPQPELSDTGRRTGYSLADVNRMREYFGSLPHRPANSQAVRMSFQNFKGGVGKTTLSCHFAQRMAERGYRVLLVDADSQASSTTTFGYLPDKDFESEDTLLPFLEGQRSNLAYAVRETHWDQLHLIPANLDLYSAEYTLASIAGEVDGSDWIDMLNQGISTIESNYDIILIDPPPALGMISLNVLSAINGLIVPVPPAMYDYHSTVTFLRMLAEVLEIVQQHRATPIEFGFMKLLVSKYDRAKTTHEFLSQMMLEHYGSHVLRTPLLQSAEIDNASADWQTVYELQRATASSKTYQRCLKSLNAVFGEIEELIVSQWPERVETTREELAIEV